MQLTEAKTRNLCKICTSNQGSEPVQGTKTKTENERNFTEFYEELKRKRKQNGLQLFRNTNVILKSTNRLITVYFSFSIYFIYIA